MHRQKTAVVFGGTGFIGKQIVRELATCGTQIKVATRVPERGFFLKPYGNIGQVVPVQCNYDEKSIAEITKGADIVVNTIGILYQKGKFSFTKAHADIPYFIAKACKKNGVTNFVHISALGIDQSKAKYAKSKLEGEKAVLKNFPNAVILRPSVVFGTDDNFFNMFAKMAQVLPALPLIGGGNTKFQPVFVGDIADAAMAAIRMDDKAFGNTYHLGGPDIASFKSILNMIFEQIGLRRRLINLPFWIAKIDASLLQLFPKPLLTPDQVELLKTDNIVPDDVKTFEDLNITPKAMAAIVPDYLRMYRRGGRFGERHA